MMATDKELEDAPKGHVESDFSQTVDFFDAMNLKSELLRGIYAYGFERPYPIQQRAIMPVIKGHDVIAQGRSGTGKTATISISTLQRIDPAIEQCQALILAPTRELVMQLQKLIVAIGDPMNIKCHACIGGKSVHDNMEALQDGPQVVVGTPGRVHDMIQRRFLKTESLKMIVLDEADEMLARGFTDQIYHILQAYLEPTQVVILSTTMPQDVLEVTTHFMHDPVRILINKDEPILKGTKHFYIAVEEERKLDAFFDLCKTITLPQTIIFCNTRKKVEWLTDKLATRGLTVFAMHGDMPATERHLILTAYRSDPSGVLIATDLLARGIDVQKISLLVNYDLPAHCEKYKHRSSREGVSLNLVTAEDMSLMREIEQFYNGPIEEMPTNVADLL